MTMVQPLAEHYTSSPFSYFLGDIAARLLNASSETMDETMQGVTRAIGERYGVDRVVLRWIDIERQHALASAGWSRFPGTPVLDAVLDRSPWLVDIVAAGETAYFSCLDELPTDAMYDRQLLKSLGFRAVLLAPLIVDDQLEGGLALSCRDEFEWTESIRDEIAALAPLIAVAYWGPASRAALRESEARYRAVVQDQTDMICRWLPDGTVTWVNDRCCDLVGKSRSELIGSKEPFVGIDESFDDLLESIQSMTPEQPLRRSEARMPLGSGSLAWIEWTDSGLFDESGKLVELQSIGRDVTYRKLAEQALAQSESRYRDLVESTTDLIWESNLDMEVVFSNSRLEDMLGYPPATLRDVPVEKLMHSDDYRQLEKDIPRLAEAGKGWKRRLLRMRHKDGQYRYLESNASPVFDRDGKVTGFRGIDRDITGVQTAEEEIRSNEAIIKVLMDSVNDAIFVLEGDSLVDCNQMVLDKFGAKRDQVLGKSPWDISPPTQPDGENSEEKARALIGEARAGKPVQFEWVHLTADGTEIYGDISLRRIENRDGVRVIGIMHDTTTLRKANKKLAERAAFQTRHAEISAAFLKSPPEQNEEAISRSLRDIGRAYGFDRVNLWWFASALPGFGRHVTWASERERQSSAVGHFRPDETPWCADEIRAGRIARIDDVTAPAPSEARVDQRSFSEAGYISILCLPLELAGRVVGTFVVFCREQRDWDNSVVQELQILASTLANAFIRRQAAIDLAQRERDLARSQQVAGVGSFKVIASLNDGGAVDYRDLYMSDEALRIFGMERGSETPRVLIEHVHPDDRDTVRFTWRNTVAAEGELELQYRILREDGSIVYVQSRSSVEDVDENGAVTVFGTFKDITEWMQANEKLRTALSEIEQLKDQLEAENIYLRDEVRAAHGFERIVGEAKLLKAALAAVEQVAPTDVSVLVTGETGTGKELISQSIHDLSHRKDKPMVSVNCAALSSELIESELFGHEKGAFTGAHARRKGRFELADGGTLFLDEIGEISGHLQAKLLRVIQEGEFERLGGSETLHADVRIIAATNRDLQKAVDTGEFRADLFYRINSFPIHMPALRERRDDIPLLVEYFVRKHAERLDKNITSISSRTMRYLRSQEWPGNVRELEGTIQRALISTTGSVLDYFEGDAFQGDGTESDSTFAPSSLVDAQRDHIIDCLKRCNWVIEGKQGAARALGLAPSSLRSKMKRLDIVRPT